MQESSIGGSGVACSTDVNDNGERLVSAELLTRRPAGCSPAGVAAKIAALRVQGYQPGAVFPSRAR
jgi:hypothetical protein